MTRDIILLDVDGVIADFSSRAIDDINRITGQYHHIEQQNKYDVEEAFGLPSEAARMFRDQVSTMGWCASIPVIDGAVDGVHFLRTLADVYVVTKPYNSQTWCFERTRWLEYHFGFTSDDIVFTGAKHLIDGDMLVEDHTGNLQEWCKWHPAGLGIRFARPWNTNVGYDGTTVTDWKELQTHIEMILTTGR